MKDTIIDLVEEEIPEGKKGFIAISAGAPQPKNSNDPKDKSFFNDVSDYAKTFLKGSVEGVTRLGRMMGPLPGKSNEDVYKEQTEFLDKELPTDEGFTQRGMRRGLKEIPSAIGTGGGGALGIGIRTAIGGFAGETAKEYGAPEWLQTAAEITSQIGPDITKKLLLKGSDKELIAVARKLGLSDEAITPLIQSEFKQKWLSKLTPRRGATQEALGKSKQELGQAYQGIQKSPAALGEISTEAGVKMIDDFDKILFEMPSNVRGKVKQDLDDLFKSGKEITGETLINFWADINHELSGNAKQLSLLKEPMREALKSIDPSMAKDFSVVNDLFSKYYKIQKRLEPNLMSDILGASEAIALLGSAVTGYYPTFLKFAGEKTARKLAQQMLINPRFQQLGNKMAQAMKDNKFQVVKKISDLISHEIRKTSPEIANQIDGISEDEFKEFLSSHQEKSNKEKMPGILK